jgi:hypothetical protein
MASESNNEILAKLDMLVRLSALSMVKDIESSKDKILFLNKVGMQPKEIAELLRTTPNHVNVTLSKERSNRKSRVRDE